MLKSVFLNCVFERKLEGNLLPDIQLLYCLDDPDCVFKHICSAELWTGFFREKELRRVLMPIRRRLLLFLNSEKSCNVLTKTGGKIKGAGKAISRLALIRPQKKQFAAFVNKKKLLLYFKGLLANYLKPQGHLCKACERCLLILKS